MLRRKELVWYIAHDICPSADTMHVHFSSMCVSCYRFYQGDANGSSSGGANFVYPDLWEAYVNHIPLVERG
jgi:hypothetical protein